MKKKIIYPIIWSVLLLGLAILPWCNVSQYVIHLMIYSFIWVILASGLNIIQGYAGYVSLGHAAFYAIGAFTSGLIFNNTNLPFLLCIVIAAVAGFVFGTLIGLPTLRIRGHYFAIATLAVTLLVSALINNLNGLTGGTEGTVLRKISGNFFGLDLTTRNGYYYFALIFAIVAIVFVYLLVRSRYGRAIISIRENEDLAEATGINTTKIKRLAFNLSAIFACVAGALYAHYMNYLNPTPFTSDTGMDTVLAVMSGGFGTVAGPAIGAFIVNWLPEVLRIAEDYRQLLLGGMLIVIVFFMPNGIVGIGKSIMSKIKTRAGERKNNRGVEIK